MENKKYYEGLSAGIMLIGLGVLFLTGNFWPWILMVVGLAQLPAALAHKKSWYAWQGFFWLVGLALLFWSGAFWPGILILVGVTMLFGAFTRGHEGSPFGSKRDEEEQALPASPEDPFSDDKK